MLSTFFCSFLALSLSVQSARAQDSNNDPSGVDLYPTAPSCGYYQCQVSWYIGQNATVNWINPIPGLVNVTLDSRSGDNTSTYAIVKDYPAISQAGYCDAGQGFGVVIPGADCGAIEFIVPDDIPIGLYTVNIASVNNTNTSTYTDLVNLQVANGTDPSLAASLSAAASSELAMPSLYSANISFLVISAPTSTDSAAAVSQTLSTPAPTASSAAMATAVSVSATGARVVADVSSSATPVPTTTASRSGGSKRGGAPLLFLASLAAAVMAF